MSSRVRQRSKRYSSGWIGSLGSVMTKSGPDEDVELGGVQAPDGLVEAGEVQDDEEVVVVLVDLRALVARVDVLVVEMMELEVLLQPRRGRPAAGARCGSSAAPRPRRSRRSGPRPRPPRARRRGPGCGPGAQTVALEGSAWLILCPSRAGHIQRGGGTGPTKPRQPTRSSRETVPIPVRCGTGHCAVATEIQRRRGHMAAKQLKCRECGTEYALEARYVCSKCFGPLEVGYDHSSLERRRRGAPPHPGRPAEHLALPRLPAARGPAAAHAHRPAGRLHAADPRRPARRAPRPGRGLGQERRRQPDALLQGPRRLGRRDARPRAGLRHARLRLDGQPRQLRRRPRRRARDGLLRAHPGRPRGAEDARDGDLRHEPRQGPRQLRRRQPPLHRAVGRPRELGLREHQHAPVLRRGLQDRRLRDRRAARLGAARPLRRADRLGLAVHEDRQGLSGVHRRRPASTATCRR